MSLILLGILNSQAAGGAPEGQAEFTTSTSWEVPAGVTSISAVAVGAGGRGSISNNTSYSSVYGGMGGGLSYSNDIAVTPGETLTIVVGAAAALPSTATGIYVGTNGGAGGFSQILRDSTVLLCGVGGNGGGGQGGAAVTTPIGTAVGDVSYTGGYGNTDYVTGGGGAAGYAANGPNSQQGTFSQSKTGIAGTGGAGGSGGNPWCDPNGSIAVAGKGGGVGLRGQTNNGTAGSTGASSAPSVAGDGGNGSTSVSGTAGGGSGYGKSGGAQWAYNSGAAYYSKSQGTDGGIRIIWGTDRSYPSTNTADVGV